MFLLSSCSCLCPTYQSYVLSWQWRCSWSSADRWFDYQQRCDLYWRFDGKLYCVQLKNEFAMSWLKPTWCMSIFLQYTISKVCSYHQHITGTNQGSCSCLLNILLQSVNCSYILKTGEYQQSNKVHFEYILPNMEYKSHLFTYFSCDN